MIRKLNHGLDRSGCRCRGPTRARLASRHVQTPAHAENNVELVNTLTRSGEAKGRRETDVGATRLCSPYMITLKSGYNPARCQSQQIVAFGPRYSAEGHYILHNRALGFLSVTESIALPPRPKGGQYVKYLQIQCSRLARACGTAADRFCAADRRYDAYPVVVHLGGPAPSAQANSAFDPMKRTQLSLACELNVRAVDALDTARKMSPGDERGGDENGKNPRKRREIHEHFFDKPAK